MAGRRSRYTWPKAVITELLKRKLISPKLEYTDRVTVANVVPCAMDTLLFKKGQVSKPCAVVPVAFVMFYTHGKVETVHKFADPHSLMFPVAAFRSRRAAWLEADARNALMLARRQLEVDANIMDLVGVLERAFRHDAAAVDAAVRGDMDEHGGFSVAGVSWEGRAVGTDCHQCFLVCQTPFSPQDGPQGKLFATVVGGAGGSSSSSSSSSSTVKEKTGKGHVPGAHLRLPNTVAVCSTAAVAQRRATILNMVAQAGWGWVHMLTADDRSRLKARRRTVVAPPAQAARGDGTRTNGGGDTPAKKVEDMTTMVLQVMQAKSSVPLHTVFAERGGGARVVSVPFCHI